MEYGVARSDNRGVPKFIKQSSVTKKNELEKVRGIPKVANLKGDDKIKGLVALSLYDSKPFYIMSNACDKVEWTQKSRKIWRKDTHRLVAMKFHRFNIVDEYNYHMKNVDVGNQLRGSYRFDLFLCKTK